MNRKIYYLFCVLIIILLFTFSPQLSSPTFSNTDKDNIPSYDESVVKSRLNNLKVKVVKPRYTSEVKGYIKGYVLWNRKKAEKILGRSLMYFPIFEKYIKRYNLPSDLKYLSVVESALDPKAVSRVGAVGLWQFMPGTATDCGLKINRFVDERCDPEKSTQAAMEYLIAQYERYGDWTLAIAAYNSGPGRVNRAIKKARSKNFWQIRAFLPKETRNYVPAFIGAAYLLQYYDQHLLEPAYPSLDLQLTETTKVFDYHSFYQIAKVTALPLDVIHSLNPSYERGFIPGDPGGNPLVLPKRVMPAFHQYLEAMRPESKNAPVYLSDPVHFTQPSGVNDDYVHSTYTIRASNRIEDLAEVFGCSIHQLRAWNKLKPEQQVVEGQNLIIYHPREIHSLPSVEVTKVKEIERLPTLLLEREVHPLPAPTYTTANGHVLRKGKFVYYTLNKHETLFDIAAKFTDVTVRDLMLLNNFKSNQIPALGTRIKIKKK